MNSLLGTLTLVSLAACLGCHTPLGSTSYPIKEVAGLEGEWLLSVFPGENEWVQSMRIERVQEERSTNTLFQRWQHLETPRYRAAIEVNTDDGDVSPLFLDGEIVQVGEHNYLTFQKAAEHPSLPLYFLEVPIQNTVRIEFEGDEIRLLWHNERYLWLPIALSGEMKVSSAGQPGNPFGVLMSNLDGVFEAYEGVDPEGWLVLATATRQR